MPTTNAYDARHSTDVAGSANPANQEPIVISIARDYGAEGHEVGKLLSVMLGIPLYDNELLVRSAQRTGVDVDQLAAVDERPQHGPLAFLPDSMDQRSGADRAFQAIRQVILDLGSTRPCIIEGRLSDYILRRNPNLISVLVTAPLDVRVEIVRAKHGMTTHDASAFVRKRQHERERFYTRYSNGKWDMYTDKDLVVDRSVFGREGAAKIIAAAYHLKEEQLGRA
ncbi:MAG: cytidylate kinase-like family protein [Olsenella sp.]|jgi:cytidylate kinase|nr:cytidylate kinase-like family protein [Olsenella sp.]MCI1289291.1 cytidylate kinase-like family protein [Olsenella sp.]